MKTFKCNKVADEDRVDVNLQGKPGNTPLIAAYGEGHVSILVDLLKLRIDANLLDDDWNTPMMTTGEQGHISVVEELVKVGLMSFYLANRECITDICI